MSKVLSQYEFCGYSNRNTSILVTTVKNKILSRYSLKVFRGLPTEDFIHLPNNYKINFLSTLCGIKCS